MTFDGGLDERLACVQQAMAAMPHGYADLLGHLVARAVADDRVRAFWVGGSIARGVADAGSDLDVLLAIADDAFDAFASGAQDWLDEVAPLVLAKQLPGLPGSVFATTSTCLRVDVVAERASGVASTPYRRRVMLIDRDRISAEVPPETEGSAASRSAIEAVIEEFYRQQAIFPAAVVGRGDWLLGVVAVHNMQVLLYRLFALCNEPLPVMGVKQWSSRLTDHQREVLAGLPAPTADRATVVTAMRAVSDSFIEEGRRAVEPRRVTWPEGLHEALSAYWVREGLGYHA